jgi:hypothetical protein
MGAHVSIDARLMQGSFPAYGTVLALTDRKGINMLWTIIVILLILWALGMVTSYTAGGLIHILLVVAVVVLLFRLISGRRVV